MNTASFISGYAVNFFSGYAVATFLASGLFFLKFWRASHDRLFLFFAIACGLIATETVVGRLLHVPQEAIRGLETDPADWTYLLRLLAFTFILVAIMDKNRSARR